MQNWLYIVRRVLAVHRSFLKKVAGAMCSFLKVFPFARHNVFKVDGDEGIHGKVNEAQHRLRDWSLKKLMGISSHVRPTCWRKKKNLLEKKKEEEKRRKMKMINKRIIGNTRAERKMKVKVESDEQLVFGLSFVLFCCCVWFFFCCWFLAVSNLRNEDSITVRKHYLCTNACQWWG